MTNEEIASDIVAFQMQLIRDDLIGSLLDQGASYEVVSSAMPKIEAALSPVRERLYAEHIAQVIAVHSSEASKP